DEEPVLAQFRRRLLWHLPVAFEHVRPAHLNLTDLSGGQGRACFDVSVSVPLAGFIAHYQGWLEAV
ncbi:MAG: hypothetical protein AAGK66_09560, partial [Pseudomonadota bacterium]